MGFEIVSLRARDIEQAHALIHKVIRNHPSYSPEARRFWESYYTPAVLRKHLHDTNWMFLVARQDGKVVGFTDIMWFEGGVTRSDWTIVDPCYRGHGIGHALMRAKLAVARKRGCHKIIADSIVGNTEGERLLKSSGFKKLARLRDYWFHQDYQLWEKQL
ncbi:GNAT family N-acetyltransferase [Candidatus Micrarchaeota archaeon]|nr:GNAT family N-acetyltransferase [Candidatus Micrarchaeota archaeon]